MALRHMALPTSTLMLKGLWLVWGLRWKAVVGPAHYALCVALGAHSIPEPCLTGKADCDPAWLPCILTARHEMAPAGRWHQPRLTMHLVLPTALMQFMGPVQVKGQERAGFLYGLLKVSTG